MIWLAWRQHRLQLAGGAAVLGLVSLYLLVTGVEMHSLLQSSGLASCLARDRRACGNLENSFQTQFPLINVMLPVWATVLLPVLAGMFLGAPLVAHDTELGLQRVAWMQSVSRTRWLAVKLALVGVPVVGGIAGLVLLLAWWVAPLVAATDGGLNLFSPGLFDLYGIVPISYMLFGLAAGVATGALIGRTIPAMAGTIVAFLGLRWTGDFLLRPLYSAPHTVSYHTWQDAPAALTGGYVIGVRTEDGAGHLVSNNQGWSLPNAVLSADCPHLDQTGANFQACAHQAGLRFVVDFQPAERYWTFQGIEAAIFGLLALALVALTVWWVRHRIS
jgi:hypothetical protein